MFLYALDQITEALVAEVNLRGIDKRKDQEKAEDTETPEQKAWLHAVPVGGAQANPSGAQMNPRPLTTTTTADNGSHQETCSLGTHLPF